MQVERPLFHIPILLIEGFLDEGEAVAVLDCAVALESASTAGRVVDGPDSSRIDPRYRINEVVHLDTGPAEATEIAGILRQRVWAQECRALWHEGYQIFDVINYATSHDLVLSRYGEGAFFRRHQDTLFHCLPARLVTLVYYVMRIPRGFTGGALVVWQGSDNFRIEPRHNLAVLFPSFAHHEVEVVRMNRQSWDAGRFSINYWFGFR